MPGVTRTFLRAPTRMSPLLVHTCFAARRSTNRTCPRGFSRPNSSQQTWSGLKPYSQLRRRGSRGSRVMPRKDLMASLTAPALKHSQLSSLVNVLVEIEPPAGVLRPTLNTAIEIKEVIRKVTDGAQLIQRDLPKAAALLGQDTIGPLFQALLCHHANQGSENAVNEAEKSEQSKCSRPSVAMYATRDDRAGGSAIDLTQLGGQGKEFSRRASELCELLRIKLEDDGDLAQASKTLRDIAAFFTRLKLVSDECNITTVEALSEMRGQT